MGTFKDYIDKMLSDEAFANEVRDAIKAKIGDKIDIDTVDAASAEVACEKGFDVSVKDLQDYRADLSETISEEELGKVSGGFSCGWALFSLAAVSMVGLIASMSVLSEPDDSGNN